MQRNSIMPKPQTKSAFPVTTSSNPGRVTQLGGKLGRRKQKLEDSCCWGLATQEIEFYVEHKHCIRLL